MFVEEKPQGEVTEAPAKVLKLSQAIRLGSKVVPDHESYCGCAMGAAYTYITGKNLQIEQSRPENIALAGREAGWALVAKLFNVPERIAEEVSTAHLMGEWNREQCAEFLESRGY